jgi:IclR family mhp operon transcriptional activator
MVLVESVCRGLDVLRIVNERADQNLSEISSAVGLPRGTSYRLLITLEAAGLVERVDSGYRVTQGVCGLSHGFDDDWIEAIASPIVRDLGAALHWPVTLCEHYAGHVVVRTNTDLESAMTLEPVRIGRRISMLSTASGRILLAFASPAKQRSLIEYVKVSQPFGASDFGGHFGEVAAVIKARGYDIMTTPNGRQTALAVPVLNDEGLAVAALAVRYFNAAMTPDEAARRLVAPLQAGADRIGRALLARGSVH